MGAQEERHLSHTTACSVRGKLSKRIVVQYSGVRSSRGLLLGPDGIMLGNKRDRVTLYQLSG